MHIEELVRVGVNISDEATEMVEIYIEEESTFKIAGEE